MAKKIGKELIVRHGFRTNLLVRHYTEKTIGEREREDLEIGFGGWREEVKGERQYELPIMNIYCKSWLLYGKVKM